MIWPFWRASWDGRRLPSPSYRRGVESVEHGEMLLQFDCELARVTALPAPCRHTKCQTGRLAWRTSHPGATAAVSHEDLPLLVASAEHRAWIAALEAFLKDEREAPPPMDRHQCRFGLWLDTKAWVRYGAPASF